MGQLSHISKQKIEAKRLISILWLTASSAREGVEVAFIVTVQCGAEQCRVVSCSCKAVECRAVPASVCRYPHIHVTGPFKHTTIKGMPVAEYTLRRPEEVATAAQPSPTARHRAASPASRLTVKVYRHFLNKKKVVSDQRGQEHSNKSALTKVISFLILLLFSCFYSVTIKLIKESVSIIQIISFSTGHVVALDNATSHNGNRVIMNRFARMRNE